MNITEDTVRSWAQAGVTRHLASDSPVRFPLCDDDIDELAGLLQGVCFPTINTVRMRLDARARGQH